MKKTHVLTIIVPSNEGDTNSSMLMNVFESEPANTNILESLKDFHVNLIRGNVIKFKYHIVWYEKEKLHIIRYTDQGTSHYECNDPFKVIDANIQEIV